MGQRTRKELESELKLAEEQRLFLTLYYRERNRRLAEFLVAQDYWVKRSRKRHEKVPLNIMSLKQLSAYLHEVVSRAEDETYCNDLCKDYFFCDLKKGHKGHHRDDFGFFWD